MLFLLIITVVELYFRFVSFIIRVIIRRISLEGRILRWQGWISLGLVLVALLILV